MGRPSRGLSLGSGSLRGCRSLCQGVTGGSGRGQGDSCLDLLQITGTWYTKAFVVDKSLVPDWKGPRKVFPVTVTALEDGSWEAKTTLLIKGRCLEKKVTLQKTEEPGRYSAYHGKKLVYIEELPESHHCIFYCESQDPGKKFRMGKLMGRNPEENLEALEEFRKFTQRKGLLAETIFTPEQTGEGPAAFVPHNAPSVFLVPPCVFHVFVLLCLSVLL
uniref:Lipocalin/cytosolic fatty-acid binding domain-containing protein n=1 Tax=Spermophilus dauricus TaxID=99837 RepID=A0A8C9UP07_SPEDA